MPPGKPWATGTGAKCQVVINGIAHDVDADDPFASTVKAMAAAKGFNKFTVLVDGKELTEGSAPTNFRGIKKVTVRKYDEAA